ncbi:MAG: EamA family transporter [Anaerolineae bacterium]
MTDRRAYLLVNVATIIWATNIILGRALRADIGPVTLTGIRVIVASIVFAVLLRRQIRRETFHGLGMLILMALTGIVGFPILLYFSLHYTTAANAAIITAISPLATLPLAAVMLRARIVPREILGMLISLLGVALIVGVSAITLGVNLGDTLSIVDAVIWAFYSVIGRMAMRSRDALATTGAAFMVAVPIMLPLMAMEWKVAPPVWNPTVLLLAVYIGVFPAAIALLSWNSGIRRLGPARAMAFYNTLPLYTSILGWAVLHEHLGWTQVVGGLLVFAGAMLAAWRPLSGVGKSSKAVRSARS